MPKLRQLLQFDPEEELAEITNREADVERIRVLQANIDYLRPAWPLFLGLLKSEEDKAIEALVAGDDPGARGVIKVVRHLSSTLDTLEREKARLTAAVLPPEGDEDAE